MKKAQPDNIADFDQHRDERRPPPGAEPAAHTPVVANPHAADVVFFDGVLAFNHVAGLGSITLAAVRQMVDKEGRAYEDRIVTGILKAPLATLQNLRAVIDDIERRANDEVAAAVAAVTRSDGETAH